MKVVPLQITEFSNRSLYTQPMTIHWHEYTGVNYKVINTKAFGQIVDSS